ncbi:MAG: hypothetical protein QOE86_3073 [Solirubrobacteraceae bacterium]|nr:hypothetical protein [Solirubrobacteraceae bacterium]
MSASVPSHIAEARFRTLIDHLGAIVWEAVPGPQAGEARFTFVSDGTETLLGYPAQRWTGDPAFWLQTIHPDDRDRVRTELAAAMSARTGADLVYRCLTADGREIWLRNIVRILKDGSSWRLHGVVVDVTERYLADARLGRLQDVTGALSGMLSAVEVAAVVAEHGRRAVGAAAVAVLLRSGEDELELAGYDGYAGGVTTGGGRIPLDGDELGQAAAQWPALAGRGQFTVIPLELEGRVLGALAIRMPPDRPVAPADRVVLGVLARTSAQALLRAEIVAAERGADAVLDAVITTAPEGFALFDTELRYVRINDALAAINGVPAGDHIGRTLRQIVPGVPADGHEAPLRRVLETGEPVIDLEVSGFTARRPARERTWLVSYYPVRGTDGQVSWLGAFVVDITERKRAEARARALGDLGTSLDEAVTVEDRVARLLDAIVPSLADAATASLYQPDGTLEPLARRETTAGEPRSSLTVTMAARGSALGVLALSSLREAAYDEDDVGFARELARRGATAIDNALLTEAERVSRDRTERQYAVAAALADALTPPDVATAILNELLAAVGADQGTVWQVADEGTAVQLIGFRGFSEGELSGHEHIPLSAQRPVATAIRSGAARWFDTAADADTAYPALGGGFARRGLGSLLVLPLMSTGRAVGALLLSATRERAFGPDERALAGALAAQAGQALERARLFEAERRVSVTLQRSLLPAGLPEIAGFEVAVRYEPAAGLEAGGDFYEVVPLADGSIGIAVGDVVGRGAHAAAAMGQLRSALRAFAQVGESPGAVLTRLSAFAETVDGAMAATAVVGRLRPDTGELRYACAGHPWPMLVHADGTVELLKEGRGVPLACLSDPVFPEGIAHLRPGSTLLLYTDGLTERRGTDVDTVLGRLAAVAGEAARAPVGDLLDRALAGTGEEPPADDVALVAVRRSGGGTSSQRRFAAEPGEVPVARAGLREWLAGVGVDAATAGDVLLAAGEAVANAVEHSGTEMVTIEMAVPEPGVVAIIVLDEGTWRDPVVAAHRGRGFGLMRMLVDEVTIERSAHGTAVRLRRRFDPPPADEVTPAAERQPRPRAAKAPGSSRRRR